MKKLVTIMLALVLTFGLGLTAFAEGSTNPSNDQEQDSGSGSENGSNSQEGDSGDSGSEDDILYNYTIVDANGNTVSVSAELVSSDVNSSVVTELNNVVKNLGLTVKGSVDLTLKGYTLGSGEKVAVTLEHLSLDTSKSQSVMHKKSDGTWESITPEWTSSSGLMFYATSFSPYFVVEGDEADVVAAVKQLNGNSGSNNISGSTDNGDSSVTSPKTGDAGMAGLILIAGAAILVAATAARKQRA